MSESDIEKGAQEQPPVREMEADDRMAELRHLLLGPEQVQIETLRERLDTPSIHAKDISRALPEAIILGAKQNNQLSTALMPTVDEIVKASVKKDMASFVDAFFPIIGPAIRKSISEAIKQMVQSLNSVLEQSFSWQGLKWRFESARTGKPFAEIVLLNMLLYRVDQVFLIHRETGLLLQHVSAADGAFQDADLVSSMLTALQDFVRDSFDMKRHQTLDTIQVGDVAIWIEQGPDALLAGAIRGNAPEKLRLKFKAALENIHLEKQAELSQFEGNAAPFESIRHHLETCLEMQLRQKEKKMSPLLPLIAGVVVIGLGAWGFLAYREHHHRADYLSLLKDQNGIVVTTAEQRDGRLYISGLRDPLAINPETLVSQSNLNPRSVVHHFKPYQALHPEFILARAKQTLQPPETVTLTLKDGILSARGLAPYQWILDARKLLPAVSGIQHLIEDDLINADLRALEPPDTVSFSLQDGHLIAAGKASNAWIKKTRLRVMTLAGIERYTDTAVVNLEAVELEAISAKLRTVIFPFHFDTTGHTPEQSNDLSRIQSDIQRFINVALLLDKKPFVEIVGHTDRSGSDQRNMNLSLARATLIKDIFISKGLRPEYLRAVGVGWREPLREERTEADKALNRSITLKPYLNGPPE